MCLNGAILSGMPVKAFMGTYAGIIVKYLDNIARNAYVYLLLYIFVRNRVLLHLIYGYMIIELNSGCFPVRQFIGGSRQWCQEWLFFPKKDAVSTAFFLLKRL
ncbi:MAG: hypothetical protein ACM3TR_02850 [Caulobacteraceae bacterium]